MTFPLKLSAITLIMIFSFSAYAGKKHCQNYREKLNNIQAQQRQSNNIKRSNSLAAQEVKARDAWWRCENGKLKKKSKNKAKQKKKAMQTKKKQQENKLIASTVTPYVSNRAVVVRAKYQGTQLHAWLKFYQPEKRCARPKSTQVVASCIEDKRRQQAEFEKIYLR